MARSKAILGRIRLSPAENILLGYGKQARRFIQQIDLSILDAIKAGTRKASDLITISNRQFWQLRNQVEFGRPLTKEQRTKRLKKHPLEYRSEKIREITRFRKRAARIRQMVKGITLRDIHLIDDKNRIDWKNPYWTPEKKKEFRKLFDRYPREEILAVLGSPPTK